MKLFHPLAFMLASPVETVEEALKRFSTEVAEEGLTGPVSSKKPSWRMSPTASGPRPGPVWLAPVRAGAGRCPVAGRHDSEFPELVEAFAGFNEPLLVLDGEILAWNSETGRALPFSSLQARLGRKRVTAEMRTSVPVVFMAFDVLSTGGIMTMEKPLQERRRMLEEVDRRKPAANPGQQPSIRKPATRRTVV